jgi:hypothetical protein
MLLAACCMLPATNHATSHYCSGLKDSGMNAERIIIIGADEEVTAITKELKDSNIR